jgi:uncharacterized protein (TIGR02145 family)
VLFNPDYNGDGIIGVDDILGTLTFYSSAWDGPVAIVIYGCTYPLFAEYDASANVDDGSCATLAVLGCTDSSYLEYDASANVDDGSCLTCCLTFTCGNNVTYQGYDYATVLIGEQCWFAENLRTTTYLNGDAIPQNLSDADWSSTTSGAMAFYVNGPVNGPDYGGLYNWYAVDDARGLCPSGWHVPTDGEWTILTDHLGGESVAGGQMKTTYGWENDGNGTNSSGFSGLPGGSRSNSGTFFGAGLNGSWWSSSPNGSNAWYRYLSYYYEKVFRFNNDQRDGFSVRCVRDAE